MMRGMAHVRIEPWDKDDLALLYRSNQPAMTEHLGGPQSGQKVLARHHWYLALTPPAGQMFHVVALPEQARAGSVGFWEREWNAHQVYQIGLRTLPEFQRRGIATAAAVAVLEAARELRRHRYVHAFTEVAFRAPNVVCARAGFTLMGQSDFEYSPGNPIRCNDWRFDLGAARA